MARILYVDDDLSVVTLKSAVLERAGHTVTTATSARDGIEKLRDQDFDAVVTDWLLGDAEGRVVVEAAKNKSNGTMPVVVVTAFISNAYMAPEPVADLYLEKPVDSEELILVIHALLKKKRLRET